MDDLKSILRSIIVSSPNALTISALNKDFYDLEGHNIPYTKHGHKTLESLLHSIPDTLIVNGTGPNAQVYAIGSSKSQHIQELVAKQKKTRKRTRPTQFINRRPFNNTARNTSKFVIPNPKSREKHFIPPSTQSNSFSQPQQFYHPQPSNHYVESAKLQQAFKELTISYPKKNSPSTSNCSKSSGYHNSPFRSYHEPNKKIYKYNSANVDGFRTTSESSSNYRGEKTYSKPSFNSHKGRYVADALSTNGSKSNATSSIKSNRDHKVSFSLGKPPEVNNYANSRTQKTHKASASEPLKVADLPQTKNESDPIKTAVQQEFINNDDAVPPYAADKAVYRVDFPENTVKYGEKIEPYKIPSNIKCGDQLQIYISEVHNPFKFWFHINTENNPLNILMHQIQRFYSSLPEDAFLIPSICITPGQICAALYLNVWHRGEIITPVIGDKVKIYFLDFGTIWNVSIKHIKYLLTRYAQLPSQALRGSLSHIKPVNLHWDVKDSKLFLSLVFDNLCFAKISEINEENRVFYMIICDDKVLQINSEMVRQKHALFDEEWQDSRIKQAGKRYHHLREDIPNFDMLERGEYPSLMEIFELLRQGIHFERITDNTVYSPYKLSMDDYASEIARKLPFELLATNPFRQDIMWNYLEITSA